ncbi:exported hypothetical protein [Thiocapsa sp. KS1]|nr:exported hypothetical protein [Thiocapsa sp. KS1]
MHFRCACVGPLGLLSQPDHTGPAARTILMGVVSTSLRTFGWQWIARSGAPRGDLPETFGPWNSV